MAQDSDRLFSDIGGRSAGSSAGAEAQQFVLQALQEAGCDEVKLEPFPTQGWERGALALELTAPRTKRIHALSLGLSCGTPPAGTAGRVVDMGYGDRKAFEKHGAEVRGCWALAEEGAPKGEQAPHRSVKLSLAHEAGALGLLLMSEMGGDLPKTGTCAQGGISTLPGVGISREEGLVMRAMLSAGKTVECRMVMENRAFEVEVSNVIGILQGREKPDELVYLGGHLDSWDISQGAMDNGSGVLVLLETARALARLPSRPRRTVAFCFFMAEEIGLCGSTHHVRANRELLDSIVSFLNLDIVSEPVQLVAGGPKAEFALLGRIARAIAPLGVQGEVDTALGLHSDHVPFLVEGIPTLSWRCRFKEESTRYCHSTADTCDKNDLKGLHLCACATSALIHAIAEEHARPISRIPSLETKAMLEEAGLEKELEAEGAWPF